MITAREYLDNPSDNEKACELHNIICEYLDSLTLDTADPKAKRMLLKLHEIDCGPHFDADIAIKAVTNMENVDGTTGQHWTFEEVEKEAQKRNIDHPADLYYAINMLYSDLSNVLGKDPEKYIAVAKALYWDDPDMPEGKLFKQYVATI
nr:MAG TPA: hypothetical protein [Caudoviricetes sp.]